MEDFMRKNPRLVGILFLLFGIGLVWWLKHTYDTGGGIEERSILLGPVLLLYGLVITVQPGMMITRGDWRQTPFPKKMLHIAMIVVGFGTGIYLRLVVFKDWK